MITNYGQERAVGEVWIDSIDALPVLAAKNVPLPPSPVVPVLVSSMTVIPAVPLTARMGVRSISN